MKRGEREAHVPGVVDTTPAALLDHLMVADPSMVANGRRSSTWFVPRRPGWIAGNLGGFFFYLIMLMFVSLILPFQLFSWLRRGWEDWWQTDAWHRRQCDRLIDDMMLQCMAVLAASRMSKASGAVTLISRGGANLLDERARGWTWRGEHRGLSLGLEVRDVHSLGGFVKTLLRLELSRQDGTPVRMPAQWPASLRSAPVWDGQVLSLEVHSSLEERQAAIEQRRSAPGAASSEDVATQVAEVIGAVLHANDLYAGDAARVAGEPAVILERASSSSPAPPQSAGGLEQRSARSALKEPARVSKPGWWQALRGMMSQWGVPFLQNMGGSTALAASLTCLYLLAAVGVLLPVSPAKPMLALPMALMALFCVMTWRIHCAGVFPQWRRRRVRVSSPRRELALERGELSLGEAARVDLRRPWTTQLSRPRVDEHGEVEGGARWLNVVLSQSQRPGEAARQLRFRVLACDSEAWRALPELEMAAPEVSAEDFAGWLWPALEQASWMHGAAQPLRARLGALVRGPAAARALGGGEKGHVNEDVDAVGVEAVESVSVGVGRKG